MNERYIIYNKLFLKNFNLIHFSTIYNWIETNLFSAKLVFSKICSQLAMIQNVLEYSFISFCKFSIKRISLNKKRLYLSLTERICYVMMNGPHLFYHILALSVARFYFWYYAMKYLFRIDRRFFLGVLVGSSDSRVEESDWTTPAKENQN